VEVKDREFVCPFAFSDPIYDTGELKECVAVETLDAVLNILICFDFYIITAYTRTRD